MKVTKIQKYRIVKDNGMPLDATTEEIVTDLYKRFKTQNILGKYSPVSDASALRMVVTVLEAYDLKRKYEGAKQ